MWSTASEFMADAQTPRRLADLAVHCASADALRARLQGTVRNFLADIGRRTPIGKLVVRVNDVLRGEAGFRLGGRALGPGRRRTGRRRRRVGRRGRRRRPRRPGPGHRRHDGGRAPPGATTPTGRPRWPTGPPSSPCATPSSTPPAARSRPAPWPGPSATGWASGQAPLSLEVAALDGGGAAGGRRLRRPTAPPTRPSASAGRRRWWTSSTTASGSPSPTPSSPSASWRPSWGRARRSAHVVRARAAAGRPRRAGRRRRRRGRGPPGHGAEPELGRRGGQRSPDPP